MPQEIETANCSVHLADVTNYGNPEIPAVAATKSAVKSLTEAIAQAVWEASHSNKMHHYTGTDAKTLAV